MKRMAIRLERLEERLPPPVPATEERPPVDFAALIAKIKAESARVDALPPPEKILAIKAKIAAKIAKAALPAPDRVGNVDIGPEIHACLVHEVKQGFRAEHHAIRGCEIAILDAAGYDTRTQKSAHDAMSHLPWQWRREDHQLPHEAQLLIDRALSVATR
jgi:hypothetical protein